MMTGSQLPKVELDHLVIAATTLEDGARYIREQMGVEMPAGGKHPRMGTHNRLMQLGSSAFLEVIAIDSEAKPPDRPRWYALDDPAMQAKLRERPRFIAWVLRSRNIGHDAMMAGYSAEDVIPVSRGTLSWQLTVPSDGSLPWGGALPHLIQWDGNARPWMEMADKGVGLMQLRIMHPDACQLTCDLAGLLGDMPEYLRISETEEPGLKAELSIAGRQVLL